MYSKTEGSYKQNNKELKWLVTFQQGQKEIFKVIQPQAKRVGEARIDQNV